jgi:hypothetical protein
MALAAPRSAAASRKLTPVLISFGEQQPVVPGMLYEACTNLHEPLLQARQRPDLDSLRQHLTAPQIAQVLGQQAQL